MHKFLDSLQVEIGMYAPYGDGTTFETIFFGGGTPSLLAPDAVGDLLHVLHESFDVARDAEITLETNPGTIDVKKLEGYRNVGINRLSFGVQSFHDDELKFLTRIHSAAQAKDAVRMAKDVGFTNISLDFIFSLPNQTQERWKSTLDQAMELEPQHISAYSLIVEHNTPLARMVQSKQVTPLPLNEEAEMYGWTMEYLHHAGYEHYEVSNYARPGFRSRHNSNYWNHSKYLGFGPSAHSFWSNRRWWNIANLNSYMEKISSGTHPLAGEEMLSTRQLFDERIMLGLRSAGINFEELRLQFGIDLHKGRRILIDPMVDEKLVFCDERSLRLTDKGFLLCDEITQRLLTSLGPLN